MLRCLKHKVFAYKNHKCSPLSLVPVTHECRTIADMLWDLNVEPLCVAHFTSPVTGSAYEHYISFCIELRKGYPINILGDLPAVWKIYTETITDDHTPLLVIGYIETFVFDDVKTVDDRIREITKEFEDYLSTRDIQATKSILMLMD